jgi:hypothetical protein
MDRTTFKSGGACVSYAAQSGVLLPYPPPPCLSRTGIIWGD